MVLQDADARRPKSDPSSATSSRSVSVDSCNSSGSQDVVPQSRRVAFLEDAVGHVTSEVTAKGAAPVSKHRPIDPNLGIWTPGAALHADSHCTPCKYIFTEKSCAEGSNCEYCHLKHESGHPKLKFRPCRGKRNRFRKMIEKMRETVEEGGELDIDELDFVLPSIKSNEFLKQKVMKRLAAEGLVLGGAVNDVGTASTAAAAAPAPAPPTGGPPGTWLPGPSSSGPSTVGPMLGSASSGRRPCRHHRATDAAGSDVEGSECHVFSI